MTDVTALGELVIDFSPGGFSKEGHSLYERQPGGAPSNVLAEVVKLGGSAALMGMLGNDEFGEYLLKKVKESGIGTEGIRFTDKAYTTLAFVHLEKSGERSFTVMRKPGADTMLEKEQINTQMIEDSKIFHVSSASLTDNPCREAAFWAAKYAKEHGKLISFDANYREVLWSRKEAVDVMNAFLPLVDILKVSEEEMELLTNTNDIPVGSQMLSENGRKLVTVTMGEKGSYFHYVNGAEYVKPYKVKMVNANGAGDAFLGGLLYQMCCTGMKMEDLTIKEMRSIVQFASACGAICATQQGALLCMPTKKEVIDFINKNT